MNRRTFLCGLTLVPLAAPLAAEGQQARKAARLGILDDAPSPRLDAFRQELRRLGWVEGQNLVVESRFGHDSELSTLAADLVSQNVDLIFAPNTSGVQAAQSAPRVTPIIFAVAGDPVGSRFVASLARPGGNATGLTAIAAELSAKRLELLKEVVPRMRRVGALANPRLPFHVTLMRAVEAAAQAQGVQLHVAEVDDPADLANAFTAMSQERVDGLLVLPNPAGFPHRARIADLAVKHRLPAIFVAREYVQTGGLIAYGADDVDLYRRAAVYVDKILKGAKPADLPVEQPTKFELVINLKTAKALGLTIPQSLLRRADEVIQ